MRTLTLTALGLLTLAACNTLPDPVAETIVVDVPPVSTCTPISALTRVTIPEKTEIYYAITEIQNDPYPPIQDKQKMTRVLEQARTIFVNSEGTEITDICNTEINPNGMTSEG